MIPTELWSGLIAALSVIIVQLLINRQKSKEADIHQQLYQQEIKNEIKSIKDDMTDVKQKLDIHNGYAEKFGDINIAIVGIQKDIQYIKERSMDV